MKEQTKCCGTCQWHQHESIDNGWVCVNDQSCYCCDWTEYNDSCEDWKEGDEKSI